MNKLGYSLSMNCFDNTPRQQRRVQDCSAMRPRREVDIHANTLPNISLVVRDEEGSIERVSIIKDLFSLEPWHSDEVLDSLASCRHDLPVREFQNRVKRSGWGLTRAPLATMTQANELIGTRHSLCEALAWYLDLCCGIVVGSPRVNTTRKHCASTGIYVLLDIVLRILSITSPKRSQQTIIIFNIAKASYLALRPSHRLQWLKFSISALPLWYLPQTTSLLFQWSRKELRLSMNTFE